MSTATSASDRYDEARKALDEWTKYGEPDNAHFCEKFAEALHALIEPAATEETPEEIADRIVVSGTWGEGDAVTIRAALIQAVKAGIQAAWESWEPENSPGYEPEHDHDWADGFCQYPTCDARIPAFKPEGEPDEYRSGYEYVVRNLGPQVLDLTLANGERIAAFDVTAAQARRILEMLSSEASD